MKFTKTEFANFSQDVVYALRDLSKKYGLVITTDRIRYDETSFTMTLKAVLEGVDQDKVDFDRLCVNYGFTSDDYKRCFMTAKDRFILIGFRPKATRKPCLIRSINDGKNYAATVSFVRSAIERSIL